MLMTHDVVHECLEAQHTDVYVGGLHAAVGVSDRARGAPPSSRTAVACIEALGALEQLLLCLSGRLGGIHPMELL